MAKRRFAIRKKFAPVKSFIVKEVPPWKKRLKEFATQLKAFGPLFAALGALLGLFLLIAFFLQLQTGWKTAGSAKAPSTLPQINVKGLDVLSVGNAIDHQHTLIGWLVVNTTSPYSLRVSLLPRRAPTEVAVLNYPGFQNTIYPKFVKALRAKMKAHNIPVVEVSYPDIAKLPPGAILIIPTSYLPEPLAQPDSPLYLPNLVKKGLYIIYIGQPFDSLIQPDGVVVSLPQEKVPFPVRQQEITSNFFHVTRGTYVIKGNTFSNLSAADTTTIGISSGVCDNGCVFVFPTIMDNPAWSQHPAYAADDVEKLISTIFSGAKAATIFKGKGAKPLFFFTPFTKSTTISARLNINLPNNRSTYIFISASNHYPGELYSEKGFGFLPYGITKMDEIFYLSIPSENRLGESYFLRIINSSGEIAEDAYFLAKKTQLPARFPFRRDLSIAGNDLATGYYIFKVDDEIGRAYAAMLVWIKRISVVPRPKVIKDNKYITLYIRDEKGNPVLLSSVAVYFDGKKIGQYYNVQNVTLKLQDLGKLSVGKHKIEFASGEWRYTAVVEKQAAKSLLTDPFSLGIILLSITIVGISTLFAKQKENYLYLDIPDFPPLTKIRVPIKAQQLEEMFEKIEKMYRWECIPLTVGELRKAFTTFTYNHRPVFVSEYNLQQLLKKAEAKGIIASAYGYYALTKWLKKIGKTIEELALYRKLRDLCIRKAVPFSGLKTNELYDAVLNLKDRKIYVHLIGGAGSERKIINALNNAGKGLNVLLFNDEASKEELTSLLFSPSPLVAMLKLAQFTGDVHLLTIKEFSEILDDLRSI